ncbi:MAG: TIGR01777 family oxidoreductase, partial [Candidatus Latescibacterota bacterium]
MIERCRRAIKPERGSSGVSATATEVRAPRDPSTMRILVSGSSGLIGTALCQRLLALGHQVLRLVRRPPALDTGEVYWNPAAPSIDAAGLEGLDAVVHLAGESIAGGRWTARRQRRIRDSRVHGTRLLCEQLAGLDRRPAVLVCASAMGYYGDRGDRVLDEGSGPGNTFLAGVVQEWEASTATAARAGIRVALPRFGMVLDSRAGALARMLSPFRLGLGGRIGGGQQYWSWVALEDAVEILCFALAGEALDGAFNAASPNPATCAEFALTLGGVLGRPTFLPLPGWAARLALGRMADELLLASVRMAPRRLLELGYPFRYPDLEGALRHALGAGLA